MDKIFPHLNNSKDVFQATIDELALDGVHIPLKVAEAMVKAREITMKRGMAEGRNIKFSGLGVMTIDPDNFQRIGIRRQLVAEFGDTITVTELNKRVRARMRELAIKGDLMSDKISKITKRVRVDKMKYKFSV